MKPGEHPLTHSIDMNTPSVARMYDWLLGGVDNYATDRDACALLLEIAPSTQLLARNNRAFLQRVVRHLVKDFGITQFLDHGSGLPTQDNVHQIAQRLKPESKVVYVDTDPIVLAQGRTLLQENEKTLVLHEDMRETEKIHEATKGFLDWKKPIAALFVSVLHCLPDADDDKDPAAVIEAVASRLVPGSCMVICQLVSDDPAVRHDVTRLMDESTRGNWGRVRSGDEVRAYFDGLTITEDGLGDVIDWRPDTPPPPPGRRATDWVEWGGVATL
ncbi:SAM-dependent methyltransferase [Streptomyces sp. NPDC004111]|uniref:SAM-dependent methyltransferase n=1 Tax=Streptomyces sp. NPDC004111 TaxID=3364690 RepID=UPI003698A0E9